MQSQAKSSNLVSGDSPSRKNKLDGPFISVIIMEPKQPSFFLFSNILSKERIKWLVPIVHYFDSKIWFTEDAVYSIPHLIKEENISNHTRVYFNNKQAIKRGLALPIGTELDSLTFIQTYFDALKSSIEITRVGYLCLTAPYMSNDALFGLQILEFAEIKNLVPEFYGYLDGIHLLQRGQSPSEFTNVKNAFLKLREEAQKKFGEFKALFCSRCATARGYMNLPIIEGASIVNLREIICRLKAGVPCLMADSIIIANPLYINSETSELKPELTNSSKNSQPKNEEDQSENLSENELSPNSPVEVSIFITHSPYNSEYMFGGLSFGLACANQGIKTQIIFIEDSTFALMKQNGAWDFDLHDFDILNVVEALDDTENLSFYCYYPSLRERCLSESTEVQYNFVKTIDASQLCELLNIQNASIKFRNVLFF